MSFQLPTAEEKHAYVHEQFERIARRYDLANDVISVGMHRGWKGAAVNALLKGSADASFPKHTSARSYLDVCTGTGDLALTIARKLTSADKVTGLDFSGNMLQVAQTRGARAHQSNKISCALDWKQGDAQALPFPDDLFDGAIISFGLRNLTDFQKGLNEMSRVVKPGGAVINLDLGDPTMPLFTPVFNNYFRHVVPIIGLVLQNDRKAYTYLPESRKIYPKPDALAEMFKQAGLTQVSWRALAFGSVALHIGIVP